MMKKIKLTRRWKKREHSHSSDAYCGHIHLQCYHYPKWLMGIKDRWCGSASIGAGKQFVRTGPLLRKSAKAAQQDAKELVVELLRDIRDGTKALMVQYGMGEDD